MDLDDMPFVLQYNKRDMENVFTLDEMNAELNLRHVPFFPATAHNGKGVVTTLKTIAMLVIEKFNVKQGFLRKAAESVNNTGVHDVNLTKEGLSVSQSAPAQPQAPAASTPFKMPSFAAKPPVGAMPSGGGSPFQKPVASPFGRPRAMPQPPRMPTFGRTEVSDDEIELRPYVPKKK